MRQPNGPGLPAKGPSRQSRTEPGVDDPLGFRDNVVLAAFFEVGGTVAQWRGRALRIDGCSPAPADRTNLDTIPSIFEQLCHLRRAGPRLHRPRDCTGPDCTRSKRCVSETHFFREARTTSFPGIVPRQIGPKRRPRSPFSAGGCDSLPGFQGLRRASRLARLQAACPARPSHAEAARSKIEMPSCHPARVVSRQTISAHVRPHGVDRARRHGADLAHKGRAAAAIAPHAAMLVIHIRTRDAIEVGIIFQGEPRPFRRKRATRSASLARGRAELGGSRR